MFNFIEVFSSSISDKLAISLLYLYGNFFVVENLRNSISHFFFSDVFLESDSYFGLFSFLSLVPFGYFYNGDFLYFIFCLCLVFGFYYYNKYILQDYLNNFVFIRGFIFTFIYFTFFLFL